MCGLEMNQEQQVDSLEDLYDEAAAPVPTAEPRVEAEGTGDDVPVPPTDEQQAEQVQDQQDVDDAAPMVPRKGYEDERKKRQTLEQERDELRKQLEELTAQPRQPQQQQPQQEIPDFYEDPEGFMRHQNQQVQRAMFENRAAISQELMREKHQDYDEMEEIFAKEAQGNPQLALAMMQSPNPARFAYETGRKIKLYNQIGEDPSAYEEQMEAKFREKYGITEDGQVEQPAAQAPAPAARAPTSLASVPSASTRPRDDRGRFTHASLSELYDD